jgi:tetratricopeptide (TPR) repeat protein
MEGGKDAYDGGAFARARERWSRALAHFEAFGDAFSAAHTLSNLGLAYRMQGQVADSLSAYERAASAFHVLGEIQSEAWMLDAMGLAHVARGAYPAARVALEASLGLQRQLSNVAGEARALTALGRVRSWLGEPAEGLAAQVEARRLFEAAGDAEGVVQAILNAGEILQQRGDLPTARARFDEARDLAQAKGAPAYVARAHGYLGALAAQTGDYGRALQELGRAQRSFEQLGDRTSLGVVLAKTADVRRLRGDYVEALRLLERAEALLTQVGDRVASASAREVLGHVMADLGDDRSALAPYKEAGRAYEASGNRALLAGLLLSSANVESRTAAPAATRATCERALAIYEELGHPSGTAHALTSLADALLREGRHDDALATLVRAHALERERKHRPGVVVALLTHGQILLARGDAKGALVPLEQARREAGSLDRFDLVVAAHALLARARLTAGSPELALETARGATQYLDTLARGQGEEHGAAVRARHVELFETGAAAAAALGDASETLHWLETGRAGALLESLGGRDAMLSVTLSDELRAAKAHAAEREAGARSAHYEVRTVAERITRESKAEARVLYPSVRTLDDVRGLLEPGEALVEYALLPDGALALVVTPGEARVVRLGSREDVVEACEAFVPANKALDPAEPARALAERVLDPLALGADVKRVLVSPDGDLSYVPFVALLPGREVAYVPSGTTLAELLEGTGERGKGVLALGDCDYATHADAKAAQLLGAGRTLKPLPYTRAEVEAVGTRRLLGREATATRLRAVVREQPRWRAIHLACHGLVDPRRPLLSSLALSAEPGDDGYWTALEVCEQPLRADLAVLSACETGKGKIVKGEGIVGLTRAFMLAGAPRVLCSLWKVDDAATQALMVRFYELWQGKDGVPGLPASEALRRAQEHVREKDAWRHPHYWAAWVLWGVPR